MAKDELTLVEKEIIQTHLGDQRFVDALDHLLYIERSKWEARVKALSQVGSDAVEPVKQLLAIYEAAAKARIYEFFFVTVNERTKGKPIES